MHRRSGTQRPRRELASENDGSGTEPRAEEGRVDIVVGASKLAEERCLEFGTELAGLSTRNVRDSCRHGDLIGEGPLRVNCSQGDDGRPVRTAPSRPARIDVGRAAAASAWCADGRNFDEVLRALDSIQLSAERDVATPVNWKPGQDVIIPTSVSEDQAGQKISQRLEDSETVPASGGATEIACVSCQADCGACGPARLRRYVNRV